METILEAKSLTKSFNNRKVVDNLSFSIIRGEVYGFLGQNGAGKSTTMRMLLGLIFPDNGTIYINGTQFDQQKRFLLKNIGAIIERPDMYGYLSGWDNLKIFAALSDKKINNNRIYEVLEIVGLRGREKDKVKGYSQGMKQRLGLAIALVHDPELLILDEPTNGLDPQGISDMRELILSLSREHQKTILISSHLLFEIEQVATYMLIIHKGKKICDGRVDDLFHIDDTLIEIAIIPDDTIITHLRASNWSSFLENAQTDLLTFKMNPAQVPDLNKWLVEHQLAVKSLNAKHSFEDYFLSLTDDSVTKN